MMNMVSLLLFAAFGYLVGSIPTAYLLVKWRANLDIRRVGSGNVGTLNSFEATGSKRIGAAVLIVDLMKGLTAAGAGWRFGGAYEVGAVAALAAVFGHNFPIWLSFKGGRGLATAAGAMLVLGWVVLPVWMVSWFVGYKVSEDVNVGNAIATIVMVTLAFALGSDLLQQWIPTETSVGTFRLFIALLALLILVRLVDPVREYITQRGSV